MLIDLNLREDLLRYFPNFEYFNCTEPPERLDFSKADNLTGMQQESFLLFWSLKQLKEHGGVGLDIGCGQGAHFATIGIDSYYGSDHPTYKGGPYIPHITSLAEDIDKIFNPNTFSFILASHILEHVNEPIITFRKWCKLLKPKSGIMILLMPDARYELPNVGSWDPTHKNFYSPRDFENNCILPNRDIMKTIEFNTLNNKFSMNYVGARI